MRCLIGNEGSLGRDLNNYSERFEKHRFDKLGKGICVPKIDYSTTADLPTSSAVIGGDEGKITKIVMVCKYIILINNFKNY